MKDEGFTEVGWLGFFVVEFGGKPSSLDSEASRAVENINPVELRPHHIAALRWGEKVASENLVGDRVRKRIAAVSKQKPILLKLIETR